MRKRISGCSVAVMLVGGCCAFAGEEDLRIDVYNALGEEGLLARLESAGGVETVPINYGHRLGPWMYTLGTGNQRGNSHFNYGHPSHARLVKTARTAMGEKTGSFAYEWTNPHPDKEITTVDVELTIDRDVRFALVALGAVK